MFLSTFFVFYRNAYADNKLPWLDIEIFYFGPDKLV